MYTYNAHIITPTANRIKYYCSQSSVIFIYKCLSATLANNQLGDFLKHEYVK